MSDSNSDVRIDDLWFFGLELEGKVYDEILWVGYANSECAPGEMTRGEAIEMVNHLHKVFKLTVSELTGGEVHEGEV